MSKLKMILCAVVIFACVVIALAYRTKINPNLYYCRQADSICILAPYSDVTGIAVEPNPPNLYKPVTNFDCREAGDCRKIPSSAIVFINE